MSEKAIKIRVKGRVQGVFYRANTKDKALELNLKGWVKNDPDGAVSIHAEGAEENLLKLMEWCKKGPNLSRVDSLDYNWCDKTDCLTSFEIKY